MKRSNDEDADAVDKRVCFTDRMEDQGPTKLVMNTFAKAYAEALARPGVAPDDVRHILTVAVRKQQ